MNMSTFVRLVLTLVLFASSYCYSQSFTDQELTELGHNFVEAINQRDSARVQSLLAFEGLAEKAAQSFSDDPQEIRAFTQGFMESAAIFGERIVSEIEAQDGVAVYLRILELEGIRGPLVRYDLLEGYNYVLLDPARTPRGIVISDLHMAITGKRLSETLGAVSQLLAAPDQSLLQKLFNLSETDTETGIEILNISKAIRQQDYATAYQNIQLLPSEIRNQRLILDIGIQVAGQLNEEFYSNELGRLARHYKNDPTAAFMLIDYYFFKQDYDEALNIINLIEKTYGSDGAIYLMKANVELLRGDHKRAIEYAQRGAALEPNNEDPQWTLFTALVLNHQYKEAVAILSALEQQFDYVFTREDFALDETFSGLIQATEFENWLNSK